MQKKKLLIYPVLLLVILCGIFIYSKKTPTVPTQPTEPPKEDSSDNVNITDPDSDSQKPTTDTTDSGSVEDGKHFIILEKINADSGRITFDRADIFFSGQDDEEIKKLGENPDELPSGYLIDNKDETQFTLTLDKNVNINLLDTESDNPATTFKTVSLEEFLKMVGTEQVHSYFYITVQNNIITDMYEQYVP